MNNPSGGGVTLLTLASITPTGADAITFNGTGNTTVTGVIGASNATSVTMSGSGNVTLSGANTFTGGLTISSGTVTANTSAAALGNGALSLGGGVLNLNNASGSGAIDNLGNNTTVTANSTITTDVASAGTGNTYTLGTLSIGTQILTVQGGSHVNGGTAGVQFGNVSETGNTTFTVNNPSGGGTTLLTLGAITPSGTDTITFNGTGNTTVTGVIGATASAVTQAGSGTLALENAETYTRVTTVSKGGTIDLGGGTANGSLSSTTLTLSGGAFNYTVTGNQTQSITTTNVNTGYSTVSAVSGDILKLGAITRTAGGSVEFQWRRFCHHFFFEFGEYHPRRLGDLRQRDQHPVCRRQRRRQRHHRVFFV